MIDLLMKRVRLARKIGHVENDARVSYPPDLRTWSVVWKCICFCFSGWTWKHLFEDVLSFKLDSF